MPSLATDFESAASAISPLRQSFFYISTLHVAKARRNLMPSATPCIGRAKRQMAGPRASRRAKARRLTHRKNRWRRNVRHLIAAHVYAPTVSQPWRARYVRFILHPGQNPAAKPVQTMLLKRIKVVRGACKKRILDKKVIHGSSDIVKISGGDMA